jgi:hypothetical protein
LSNQPKGSPQSEPIPLKQTICHMAGQNLNKGQQEANKKLSGMSPLFYVNQLLLLLRNGLLPEEDESLKKGLKALHQLLGERLVVA